MGSGSLKFDRETSSVGQCCPMPLIKLSAATEKMKKGQILKISGDDPIFEIGVKDYCTAHGLRLLHTIYEGRIVNMFIKV